MSTPFQPSDPHAPAMNPGIPTIVLVSVLCALGVVMIVSIIIPRVALDEGLHWGVSLGAGAVTLAIVFVYGMLRRRQDAEEQS